jgi:hypothetical protein
MLKHPIMHASWSFGKVELIDLTTQRLHVNISSLVNQYTFVATFVYGYNTVIAYRAL